MKKSKQNFGAVKKRDLSTFTFVLLLKNDTDTQGHANISGGNCVTICHNLFLFDGKILTSVIVVEIFMTDDLKTRGATLTRYNGRPGEEDFPDSIQPNAVLGANRLLHLGSHPILVPAMNGVGVMNSDGLDAGDFESGRLQMLHDKTQWTARVQGFNYSNFFCKIF